ncbi:MAG: phosphoenolpyruvate-protein phosphotransferase system enzyme [Acidobacteriota bacterium]|nr:phosphoenolpyruvate-protein phosphotransferase system enzyme [Acidobacteriota bacterium]
MNRRRKVEEQEARWQGLGVSDGVVVGRVLRVFSGVRQVYRATLDAKDVERETRRLRAAVRLARVQLLAIKARAEKELGADHAYIFDAHLLMLEDRKLLEDVEKYIRDECANAEWAVKVAADRLLAIYAEIKDDYLRERGSDIEDVTQRLLVALSGESLPGYRKLTEDAVIVAEDLLPSAVAELDFEHARAIATDAGGWTSHTAIIARGLRIPAIVGLRDLHRKARTGDRVIVDAQQGTVILHPSSSTLAYYKSLTAKAAQTRYATTDDGSQPLRTLDGKEIILRANVELPAEFEDVRRFGARGIGLYRSEFLLAYKGVMPSEDEQCRAYIEVAELAGEEGATVRLFDLGGDKMGGAPETERNPALGLRAIRFSLMHEDVLRTQARAILRAAAHGRLDIVLPMISDVMDVRRARRIINEERARLESEGQKIGAIRIGAMIEVPSAVVTADKVASEVDFFSLGTNDLVQYLLAVDRGNEGVADWFRSLHPAVLQSISRTLDAARRAFIPAIICGEMASTPAYAVVLIGLGATELSMTAASIPRVRRAIAAIKFADAQAIAHECLECETADDVEELVRVRFSENWAQLFPPKSLPARRVAE